MDNNIIQTDQISSEQHLHIENQKDQNSTLNNTKSKEVHNGIEQREKNPMIPTPLYVFFLFFLKLNIQIFH